MNAYSPVSDPGIKGYGIEERYHVALQRFRFPLPGSAGFRPQRRAVCCAVRKERDHAAGGEEPATNPRASSDTREGKRSRPVA